MSKEIWGGGGVGGVPANPEFKNGSLTYAVNHLFLVIGINHFTLDFRT